MLTPIENSADEHQPDLIPESVIIVHLPADFLSNSEWPFIIRKNVKGVLNNEDREVHPTTKEQADQVGLFLKGRLESHITMKIRD